MSRPLLELLKHLALLWPERRDVVTHQPPQGELPGLDPHHQLLDNVWREPC